MMSMLLNEVTNAPRTAEERAELDRRLAKRFGVRCAPVVIDSCGFTRTTLTHGIGSYLFSLVRMRAIALPILESGGGFNVSAEADNLFAFFHSPDEALGTARKLHAAMREADIPLGDEEAFQLCIGIGWGELLNAGVGEGFYGTEMNLASKLGEDTAVGGETLLTESAFNGLAPQDDDAFFCHTLRVSGIELPYYALSVPGPGTA